MSEYKCEDVDGFGCIFINNFSGSPFKKLEDLLVKSAKQCSMIMKKYSLYVDELRELDYKSSSMLWGLNEHEEDKIIIYVRLRSNSKMILEYESILGTLLHELVHNTIAKHDEGFYKLLKQYENEVYSLQSKGVYGPGSFDSSGRRLGGMNKTNSILQNKLLGDAAEKRKKTYRVSSPSQLGGDIEIKRILSPREARSRSCRTTSI